MSRSPLLSIPFDEHALANGLRVVLSPEPAVPVVAVNLWYGVGSRNERAGKTGFAHLFEHMMFQGSKHVPKNRHFELVERAGGSLNASTWFDRTNYFETVPSHHLELALWLESDRMGWMLPAMTPEKLENQRDVVKNERSQRYDNQPYGDWDERLQSMIYPAGHPYHHPVIGSVEDIDAASLEDIDQFFRTFYIPNNAVLTICGDFERDRALELVERYFGAIPAGDPIPELPGQPELSGYIGTTVRQVVEGDVPLPRVYVAGRAPTCDMPAFYAAEVAGDLLGKGRASRLYRSLVLEKRLAKDVVTYVFPLMTGAGMMLVWATGHPGVDPQELERAIVDEMEGLATASEEEVARAVALAETGVLGELETVSQRADLLSMFTTHFGDPGRLNTELDRLREVTPADVRAFAEGHLSPENRAILTYVPRSQP